MRFTKIWRSRIFLAIKDIRKFHSSRRRKSCRSNGSNRRKWKMSCKGTGSTVSCKTQRQSKRCKIGSVSSTFSERVHELSYRPPIGLAAAMTEHRAWREVTMPALDIEMDCCSMASWIEVRSCSFILSNSSMRQTPRSLRASVKQNVK